MIRGEVFVTNIEYGTTKRITNTPEQERNVSFSPDGRKLVYSAERNGQWNIYMSEIVRSGDDQFVYASEIKEIIAIDHKDLPSFEPIFSPDGKIAFLRDRSAIYAQPWIPRQSVRWWRSGTTPTLMATNGSDGVLDSMDHHRLHS